MNTDHEPRPTRLEADLSAMHCAPASQPTRGRILFLHGMNAGAWQFERLQPFFAARGYESLALNYRGHHDSRPVRAIGRVTLDEYVEDASIAARALGRPVVVGQSMGGLIAQKLAEASAVSAAVALCSLPPRGIPWLGSSALLAASVRSLPAVVRGAGLLASRSALDALIFNYIEPPEREGMYRRQVPESARAGFQVAVGAMAIDAARVRCPVLSVTAEHDRLVLPSVGRAIARKYRGDLIALLGCGHYALVGERGWEPRADAIATWLQKQEARI